MATLKFEVGKAYRGSLRACFPMVVDSRTEKFITFIESGGDTYRRRVHVNSDGVEYVNHASYGRRPAIGDWYYASCPLE